MTLQNVLLIFGLVALIAIELLRWLAGMPPETCTALTAIAWLCIGGLPAIHAVASRRNGGERGSSAVGLLAAIVVLALVPLLLSATAGCGVFGPTRVEAEHSITWQRRPGPTCYVRTLADGEVATETTAPTSCVPPPEFCAPGPGEPGYQVAP